VRFLNHSIAEAIPLTIKEVEKIGNDLRVIAEPIKERGH
jgi:hypothetical protein